MRTVVRLVVLGSVLVLAGAQVAAGAPKPVGAAGAAGGRVAKPSKRVVKNAGPDRAFTVLRALLPADVTLVGGVHLAGIRGTEPWKKIRQQIEKDGDLKDAIGSAKDACGLDLIDAAQDVAFASRGGTTALLAVAWRGIGESELADCALKVAAKKNLKVKVDRSGQRLRLEVDGESIVMAWPTPDVMVFAFDPTNGKALDDMLGGKGAFMARADVKRALALVPAGAVSWAVYLGQERLGGTDVRGVVGALSAGGGQLTVQAWIQTADADAAKRTTAEWVAFRDQFASDPGTPEVAKRMLAALQIAADGERVVVALAVSEKDLMLLLALF